ncbi:MAG: GcrA family cell cycle regulator [Reyranellaceae bacterium]
MKPLAYTGHEIGQIAQWLRDGLSSSEIARRMTAERHATVSRNAIIGLVSRDSRLKAIGFARAKSGPKKGRRPSPGKPSPPSVKPARQNLHAGNIAGKKEGRKLDAGYAAPKPKPQADGRSPYVYDATSHHPPLVELSPRDCRFPVNDAKPGELHLFCGMPAAPAGPYCRHHALRCRGAAWAESEAA